MYDNGIGPPQDYTEVVRWYRIAAELGAGPGTGRSWVHVQGWYWGPAGPRRGMQCGHSGSPPTRRTPRRSATLVLSGLMHANGTGVPQNHAEAMRPLQLAADQGDAQAQSNLGEMYHNGIGVPQDDIEFARLFTLA